LFVKSFINEGYFPFLLLAMLPSMQENASKKLEDMFSREEQKTAKAL